MNCNNFHANVNCAKCGVAQCYSTRVQDDKSKDDAEKAWNSRTLEAQPKPQSSSSTALSEVGLREALVGACDALENLIESHDYLGTGSSSKLADKERAEHLAELATFRAALSHQAPVPTSGAVEVAREILWKSSVPGVELTETHVAAIIQQYGINERAKGQEDYRVASIAVIAAALATQPPAADGKPPMSEVIPRKRQN